MTFARSLVWTYDRLVRACYVSVDDEKAKLAGYNPQLAAQFHRESARQADKRFAAMLKSCPFGDVVLLCGGTASGKTEFFSEYLDDQECIVYDSTLPTPKGAEIKIRKALHAGKRPVICAVLPDDLVRAFIAFLGRDRKFPVRYFYRTHAGSRRTLRWIARHYPDVEIRLYESSMRPDNVLGFSELAFSDKDQLREFLKGIQVSQRTLSATIRSLL